MVVVKGFIYGSVRKDALLISLATFGICTVGSAVPIFSLAMFLSFVSAARALLGKLKENMLAETTPHNSLFKMWKHVYLLICDYGHEINRSFGPSILALLTCTLVKVVSNGFYMILRAQKYNVNSIEFYTTLVICVKDIGLLVIMLYVPTKIEQEVS